MRRREALGTVAGEEPLGCDLRCDVEPDAVVPQATQLGSVEEDAVDDEGGVGLAGDPFGRDRGILHRVECGEHEAATATGAEWIDKHAAKGVVVVLVTVERLG